MSIADKIIEIGKSIPDEEWLKFYENKIESLQKELKKLESEKRYLEEQLIKTQIGGHR